MNNKLKKWMVKNAIWIISLTIVGYVIIWFTEYLFTFTTDAMAPANPIENPIEATLIVLFSIPLLFPILAYVAAVAGFICGSIMTLNDIMRKKTY